MKALSIKQPWAWCIVTGRKPVENRSWPTKYRGRFLVHAGKSFDVDGFNWLYHQGMIPPGMPPADFPRGGIVGSAVITDCVDAMDTPWFFGPYGFTLERGEELPFLPMRGQLGFFDPKLTFADFNSMAEEATDLGHLKAVVESLDAYWRDPGIPDMKPDDWVTICNTCIASKRRIEAAQRVEAVANG